MGGGEQREHGLGAPRRRAVGLEQHDLLLEPDGPRLTLLPTGPFGHRAKPARRAPPRASPRGPLSTGRVGRGGRAPLPGRAPPVAPRPRPPQIVAYGGGGFSMEP